MEAPAYSMRALNRPGIRLTQDTQAVDQWRATEDFKILQFAERMAYLAIWLFGYFIVQSAKMG